MGHHGKLFFDPFRCSRNEQYSLMSGSSFLPRHTGTELPSSLSVMWGHVTTSGQWNVSRSDMYNCCAKTFKITIQLSSL